MDLYGKQLIPLMHEIAKRQGVKNIDHMGAFSSGRLGVPCSPIGAIQQRKETNVETTYLGGFRGC